MNQSAATDLQKLGRDAAQDVAGVDTVEEVEVVSGEDSTDRPVYKFYFLIEKAPAKQRAGLLRTRLVQRLRDELAARGDTHYPIIHILSRTDWEKRAVA